MTVKKVIFRLREQDEETPNEVDNQQEQPVEDAGEHETFPDETLAFDALINMIVTVRDSPGLIAMDDEDKREIWPVVKRSLAKYSGRLQGVNLNNFRNYFRS